jgi:hypothetical protein
VARSFEAQDKPFAAPFVSQGEQEKLKAAPTFVRRAEAQLQLDVVIP